MPYRYIRERIFPTQDKGNDQYLLKRERELFTILKMLHQWIFNMITDVLNVNQMNVDWQLSHLSLEVVGKVQKRNKEGENWSLITLEWEWKIDPYLPEKKRDRKKEKEKTKDLLLHQRPLSTCERERNRKRDTESGREINPYLHTSGTNSSSLVPSSRGMLMEYPRPFPTPTLCSPPEPTTGKGLTVSCFILHSMLQGR